MTPDELRQIEMDYRAAALEADELRVSRNKAVHDAIAEGMSHADIAKAMGLGRARIGQIALMSRD